MSEEKIKQLTIVTDGVIMSITKIAALEKHLDKYNQVINSITGLFESIGNIAKDAVKIMLSVTGGIALLGLTVITIGSELDVGSILKIGLLGVVMSGTAYLLGKSGKDALFGAAAIGVLGLSIWAFSEVVTPEMAVMTTLALLGIGVAMKLFAEIANPKTMLFGALGIAVLGLSIYGLSLALEELRKLDWETW